jgi:hypothetical protein
MEANSACSPESVTSFTPQKNQFRSNPRCILEHSASGKKIGFKNGVDYGNQSTVQCIVCGNVKFILGNQNFKNDLHLRGFPY